MTSSSIFFFDAVLFLLLILVSGPSFMSISLPLPPRLGLRYFRQFPPSILTQPSCPNPTQQPSLHIINKYQKDGFTSSAVTFYQKSILLQIYLVILIYGIFLDKLKTFFHKIMVAEKKFFSHA